MINPGVGCVFSMMWHMLRLEFAAVIRKYIHITWQTDVYRNNGIIWQWIKYTRLWYVTHCILFSLTFTCICIHMAVVQLFVFHFVLFQCPVWWIMSKENEPTANPGMLLSGMSLMSKRSIIRPTNHDVYYVFKCFMCRMWGHLKRKTCFLIVNIIVEFNGYVFQRTVAIPMGIIQAPLLVDLLLYSNAAKQIK